MIIFRPEKEILSLQMLIIQEEVNLHLLEINPFLKIWRVSIIIRQYIRTAFLRIAERPLKATTTEASLSE